MKIKFGFFLLFLVSNISFSQTDCSFLKHCKLKYADGNTGIVIIDNNKHFEYTQDGKYYIKSQLEWVSDCEYNATLIEVKNPDFHIKIGTVLNAKFERIEGKFVYGIGTCEGQQFPIKFEILEFKSK